MVASRKRQQVSLPLSSFLLFLESISLDQFLLRSSLGVSLRLWMILHHLQTSWVSHKLLDRLCQLIQRLQSSLVCWAIYFQCLFVVLVALCKRQLCLDCICQVLRFHLISVVSFHRSWNLWHHSRSLCHHRINLEQLLRFSQGWQSFVDVMVPLRK